MKHDFLIVGAGLFGAVCAAELRRAGKSCLVVEKCGHVGGAVRTELQHGIHVHQYGVHVFHTHDPRVWEYVTARARFNGYVHRVRATAGGREYTLPISLTTLREVYGTQTAAEATEVLRRVCVPCKRPANLEELALASVGPDIYRLLIEGYSAKQWGRHPRELPASILRRFPLRRSFEDRYFGNCRYSGVPESGYTELVQCLLDGTPIELNTAFPGETWRRYARRLIFTGSIDVYFQQKLGMLQYRTVRFKHYAADCQRRQDAAQVNYCDCEVPYTRVIEHKQLYPGLRTEKTVLTGEYPVEWTEGDERYYPIRDDANSRLYRAYAKVARGERDVSFGGRLGTFRYCDMDQTIMTALELAARLVESTPGRTNKTPAPFLLR